jgi:hypothetical protein
MLVVLMAFSFLILFSFVPPFLFSPSLINLNLLYPSFFALLTCFPYFLYFRPPVLSLRPWYPLVACFLKPIIPNCIVLSALLDRAFECAQPVPLHFSLLLTEQEFRNKGI